MKLYRACPRQDSGKAQYHSRHHPMELIDKPQNIPNTTPVTIEKTLSIDGKIWEAVETV